MYESVLRTDLISIYSTDTKSYQDLLKILLNPVKLLTNLVG